MSSVSNQTSQPFFDSNLRLPAQLFSNMTQIGNVIQRHGRRQRVRLVDYRLALNDLRDLIDNLTQRCRVLSTAAKIIQTSRYRRIDECPAGARKVVNMQDIADRPAFKRQTNRPTALYRFHIMRHKTIFVSIRRPRGYRLKSKAARAEASFRGII